MNAARKEGALATFLLLSSIANIAGGLVLMATWGVNAATDPQGHVPHIVVEIGGAMLIQGLFTAGYVLGWWDDWGDLASGALLAGQLISGCAGLALLIAGIFFNARAANGGVEPAPVLAALLIGTNAFLALILLLNRGVLSPRAKTS